MSSQHPILRLLLALIALCCATRGQDLVSAVAGVPGTVDAGYVRLPLWMGDADESYVFWSRPAVLADGTILYVVDDAVPVPYVGVPGEDSRILVSDGNGIREIVSAGGFHLYVHGGDDTQSLWYKTNLVDVPGLQVPTEGLVEIRHLRAVADGSGTQVVFTGVDTEGTTGVYVVTLLAAVGPMGGPVVIPGSGAGASFPDVAADGASFVFRRADGRIVWRTVAGVADLGEGTEPAISADGSTICFVATGTVVVVDTATGTIDRIGDSAPGVASSPALSDDGRFVVFRSTAPLVAGLGEAELAHAQIYLYDRNSAGLHCLTGGADGDSVCPAIEGSGRYLAFASQAASLGANEYYQIFRFDRGTDWASNHAPVLSGSPAVYCEPNDANLANMVELPLVATDPEGDAVEIGVLTGPTAAQGTVVDREGAVVDGWVGTAQLPLSFRPADGFAGSLALQLQARDRGGDPASLVTLPVAVEIQIGTVLTCLTGALDASVAAPWSTFAGDRVGVLGDSEWLFFGVGHSVGSTVYRLQLYHPDSDLTIPVYDGTFSDLAWPEAVLARQAQAGVYCTSDALHWFRFSAAGIGTTAVSDGVEITSPSISDDGTTVAFERKRSVFEREVCIWRPESGTEPTALIAGHSPALSGDGRVLAYVDETGNMIKVLRGADGVFDTTPVTFVGDASGSVGNLRLSAGGRYLLYESGTPLTLSVVDLAAAPGPPVLAIANAQFGELAASGSFCYYVDSTGTAHWRSLLTDEDRVLCGDARRAVLSPDGRFVTLASLANLAGGRADTYDIYRAPVPFSPNHAPTASSATEEIAEDPAAPLEFALGFADADAWDRDLLVTITESPLYGTAEIHYGWDGITVVYTPGSDFAGTDVLVYQVTDGAGQFATGTITIQVTAVDDAPMLAEIPDQRLVGGPAFADIDLAGYLTEVDGDGLDITVSGQTELTVTVGSDRIVHIVPPTDHWSGSETITLTVTDQTVAALQAERSFVLSNWYRATQTFSFGWNAVAFPIQPSAASTAAVLALTNRDVRHWTGTVNEVVAVEGLRFVPGQGYWIYVPQEQAGDVEIYGSYPASDEVTLQADGWSLVGPVGMGTECPLPAALSARDVSHFSPTLLRLVPLGDGESLQAGQAYWIHHAGAATTVSLPLQTAR